MTSSAIGHLTRRYRAILVRCAQINAFGWIAIAAMVPAARAQGVQTAALSGIDPDGRTAAQVARSGSVADVTTSTVRGGVAFNSFTCFDVSGGEGMRLHLPDGSSRLLNLVGGPRSQIDGWVRAYQGGRIGGDVYVLNPNGIVVGAGGVLEAGRLTLAAPTPGFMGSLLDGQSHTDGPALQQLLAGQIRLSAGGLVRVQGRLQAADGITLAGGTQEDFFGGCGGLGRCTPDPYQPNWRFTASREQVEFLKTKESWTDAQTAAGQQDQTQPQHDAAARFGQRVEDYPKIFVTAGRNSVLKDST